MKRHFVLILGLAAWCLTASPAGAAGEKMTREEIETQLAAKNQAIREISNAFAGQQKQTALLKVQRAMLMRDAEDPMLTEEEREKLQEKITGIESEMDGIEMQRVKNRSAFAQAAQDYETFARKNLPETPEPSE